MGPDCNGGDGLSPDAGPSPHAKQRPPFRGRIGQRPRIGCQIVRYKSPVGTAIRRTSSLHPKRLPGVFDKSILSRNEAGKHRPGFVADWDNKPIGMLQPLPKGAVPDRSNGFNCPHEVMSGHCSPRSYCF